MKTVLHHFAISIAALLVMALTQAPAPPTVEEILHHYERAMGGKAAFGKVVTMVIRGTIEFPSYNLSGTTTEYFKAPNYFLTVTEIPGYGRVRSVYDGKSGWTEDPKQSFQEITGPALDDMRRRADIQWHVKLKELYPGLKLKGRETIAGKDAWVLEVTQDNWTFGLCFDVATGLMVRFDTDTGGQNGASRVFIGDYRPVANMQFSYAATMSTTKVVWTRQLSEVKFNVPVDSALFLKAPVSGGA
jgi:hypothetical protein